MIQQLRNLSKRFEIDTHQHFLNSVVTSILGGIIYSGWAVVVMLLMPNANDGLVVRLPPLAFALISSGLLIKFKSLRRFADINTFVVCLIAAIAQMQLFENNLNSICSYSIGIVICLGYSQFVQSSLWAAFSSFFIYHLVTAWSFHKVGWNDSLQLYFIEVSTMLTLALCLCLYRLNIISKLQSQKDENQRLVKKVAEVAHDIRAPYAALGFILSQQKFEPEEQKLVQMTFARLQGLADRLLDFSRTTKVKENASQLITSDQLCQLIKKIVSEKQSAPMQANKIGFTLLSNKSFSILVDPDYLSRIISNLIQNSLEVSAKESIAVLITLEKLEPAKIRIVISDNGPGVTQDILKKLGGEGQTFGKSNGNGLGLFQAKQYLESIGGSLRFESSNGFSNIVEIKTAD